MRAGGGVCLCPGWPPAPRYPPKGSVPRTVAGPPTSPAQRSRRRLSPPAVTWSPPALSPRAAFPTRPRAPFTFFADLILSGFQAPWPAQRPSLLATLGAPLTPASPTPAQPQQPGTHRPAVGAGARWSPGRALLGPCWVGREGEEVSAGWPKAMGFMPRRGGGGGCPLAPSALAPQGLSPSPSPVGPSAAPSPPAWGQSGDEAAVRLTQKCHPLRSSDTHAGSTHAGCGVTICLPSLPRGPRRCSLPP